MNIFKLDLLSIIMVLLATIIFIDNAEASTYNATLVKVYDGDTVYLDVATWIDTKRFVRLRLIGIDTPEIRRAKECEKIKGRKARAYLASFLQGKTLLVTRIKYGKYAGRHVGVLMADGINVSVSMIKSGHAVVYNSGRRTKDWCN